MISFFLTTQLKGQVNENIVVSDYGPDFSLALSVEGDTVVIEGGCLDIAGLVSDRFLTEYSKTKMFSIPLPLSFIKKYARNTPLYFQLFRKYLIQAYDLEHLFTE